MNGTHRLRTACLGVLTLALSAAPPGAWAEDSGDVGFVSKGDRLPNDKVINVVDVRRVQPLLAALPEGHRLRVEFTTIPSATTGYQRDTRFIHRVVALGPGDKPDGPEVNYTDWYRHCSRTATYTNGVLDGVEQQFDVESGVVVAETPWVKGAIHGVKRTFHPNGKLANETTYEKGVIKGISRSYTDEGQVSRIVPFVGGEREGDTTDYWPENPAVVKQVLPYHKGKVDGVAKAYYLSGKLKWERPFKDNRQHGIEKQYAVDGTVEKTVYWLNGDSMTAEEYKKQGGK